MPHIRRGTTPSVLLVVPADFSEYPTVELAIQHNGGTYTLDKSRLEFLNIKAGQVPQLTEDLHLIRFSFSQDETLSMTSKTCSFQLRVIAEDGQVISSVIVSALVTGTLDEEVIYG